MPLEDWFENFEILDKKSVFCLNACPKIIQTNA